MSGVVIKRGAVVIADGNTALFIGNSSQRCTHALDFVNYIRGTSTSVFDRFTKTGSFDFAISREFGTFARALDHARRGPALATGRHDFVMSYYDGAETHVWTLANAGWEEAEVEDQAGVRVQTAYTITGGLFAYSGGSLAGTYSDAIT